MPPRGLGGPAGLHLPEGGMIGSRNPRRAQICRFELFELLLLLKLDKQLPVAHFEATVSQSTVPSPPLNLAPLSSARATAHARAQGCPVFLPRTCASVLSSRTHHASAPAKRVLSPTGTCLLLASSFGKCLNCAILKGMFPWRTR